MFTQRHVTNLFVSTQPFTHTRTVLVIKYTSACLFGCDSNNQTHLSPHLLLHATDRISPHYSSRLGSHPPLTKNRRIFQVGIIPQVLPQQKKKRKDEPNFKGKPSFEPLPAWSSAAVGNWSQGGRTQALKPLPYKASHPWGGEGKRVKQTSKEIVYICTVYWYHHSSHLLGPCFWSWVLMPRPKSHLFFQQCSKIWSATWRWVKECNNP